jgi:site-specific recombinase XerD
MATTKFYLDTRSVKKGEPAPLKITITLHGKSALLPLNIKLLPSQWDAKTAKISNHPNKNFLNTYIIRRKLDVDTEIMRMKQEGGIGRDVTALKNKLVQIIAGEDNEIRIKFIAHFLKFANAKKESTKEVYMQTYRRLQAYCDVESLYFEDITNSWLVEFENFLAKTANKNARNIHLRNIRAVFNDAINEELTTAYPFRRFKIRPIATAKRSLTIEQLRQLFAHPVEEYAEQHRDMFKLIFYLIGINIIDLFNLEQITNEGRIEYYRAKTGRMYSIKVEPEALAIINKYRGQRKLLSIADNYSKHNDYAKHLNRALQRIGNVTIGKRGAKTIEPLFPELTTYWARHTWATIAAELEIPKETIAAALGHGGNTVTDIYIDFDRKKVDVANRRVLDWVLYAKK